MTIGSTANIASAFNVLRNHPPLKPLHRLALILISDGFGMGAAKVDCSKLDHLLGTEDHADARSAVEHLAACGYIRLSDWHGDVAFAGSLIATEQEIANVRSHLDCAWPFVNWTGKP